MGDRAGRHVQQLLRMLPRPALQALRFRRPVPRWPVLLHPARFAKTLVGHADGVPVAGDVRLRLQRPASPRCDALAEQRVRPRHHLHRHRPGRAAGPGVHRRDQAHRQGRRPVGAGENPGVHRRDHLRDRAAVRPGAGHADDHRQERLRSGPGFRRPDRQRHYHGREAWRVRQRSRSGQCT
ncbi:hypothetical protein D3C80_1330310 [compost metagenome]